jgi:hypothetical protein
MKQKNKPILMGGPSDRVTRAQTRGERTPIGVIGICDKLSRNLLENDYKKDRYSKKTHDKKNGNVKRSPKRLIEAVKYSKKMGVRKSTKFNIPINTINGSMKDHIIQKKALESVKKPNKNVEVNGLHRTKVGSTNSIKPVKKKTVSRNAKRNKSRKQDIKTNRVSNLIEELDTDQSLIPKYEDNPEYDSDIEWCNILEVCEPGTDTDADGESSLENKNKEIDSLEQTIHDDYSTPDEAHHQIGKAQETTIEETPFQTSDKSICPTVASTKSKECHKPQKITVTPEEQVTINPTVTPEEQLTTNPIVTPEEQLTTKPTVTPEEQLTTNPIVTPEEQLTTKPPSNCKECHKPQKTISKSRKTGKSKGNKSIQEPIIKSKAFEDEDIIVCSYELDHSNEEQNNISLATIEANEKWEGLRAMSSLHTMPTPEIKDEDDKIQSEDEDDKNQIELDTAFEPNVEINPSTKSRKKTKNAKKKSSPSQSSDPLTGIEKDAMCKVGGKPKPTRGRPRKKRASDESMNATIEAVVKDSSLKYEESLVDSQKERKEIQLADLPISEVNRLMKMLKRSIFIQKKKEQHKEIFKKKKINGTLKSKAKHTRIIMTRTITSRPNTGVTATCCKKHLFRKMNPIVTVDEHFTTKPIVIPEEHITNPTVSPKEQVTINPTVTPEEQVTINPTVTPEEQVTTNPTVTPEEQVTINPTVAPEEQVTINPTVTPEEQLTTNPIVTPEEQLTTKPTVTPEEQLTTNPIVTPEEQLTTKPPSQPFQHILLDQQSYNNNDTDNAGLSPHMVRYRDFLKKNVENMTMVRLHPDRGKNMLPYDRERLDWNKDHSANTQVK